MFMLARFYTTTENLFIQSNINSSIIISPTVSYITDYVNTWPVRVPHLVCKQLRLLSSSQDVCFSKAKL